MQNEVPERDRDGDLMWLVGRHSDCGDSRWTPRYRDSQVVTVNIKMTSCTKYMRACRHSGAQPCSPQALAFRSPAVFVRIDFLSHGCVPAHALSDMSYGHLQIALVLPHNFALLIIPGCLSQNPAPNRLQRRLRF